MKINHATTINREEILGSFIPLLSTCKASTDIEKIMSSSRKKELVDARAIIATCLRSYGFTFSQIGYVFNRDHSSAMYLLRRTEENGRVAFNKQVIEAFKNPTLTSIIGEAIISYHRGRIKYHQDVIKKLNS